MASRPLRGLVGKWRECQANEVHWSAGAREVFGLCADDLENNLPITAECLEGFCGQCACDNGCQCECHFQEQLLAEYDALPPLGEENENEQMD